MNVYWQHDERTPDGGAYYKRSNDVIYLEGSDEDDGDQDQRFTMLHEYGYHVTHTEDALWNGASVAAVTMYLMPPTLPAPGVKGWANIIPSLVDNASLYPIEHSGSFSYDFENHLVKFQGWNHQTICPHPTNRPTAKGELVEGCMASAIRDIYDILSWITETEGKKGCVASAIWDIYDSNKAPSDKGQDNLNQPASNIWQAFKKGNINKFETWVTNWNSNSSNPSIDDILRLLDARVIATSIAMLKSLN